MKTLIASILAIGLCTAAVPAHAAAKSKPTPTLRVSKAKAKGICRDVSRSPKFKKAQRKATKRKALTRKQSNAVANEVCRFYAADANSQKLWWEKELANLVEQGKLTKADQKLLSRALEVPDVLPSWKPTTEFGRQVLAGIEFQDGDDYATEANSGAGWVIGGIIGGIAGGVMTGGNPAGIGAGIAVGGAAGSLAETAFSGDDGDGGDTEEGGDGGDGGGDGGGEGGGGSEGK